MKRPLLFGLIALIVLPMILLIWMVTTQSGMRWSFRQAQPNLPESLAITGLSGRLIGPLTFEEISYEDQGRNLNARQITLDWNPWSLLQAEINISNLQVRALDIVIPAVAEVNDSETRPISLPHIALPLGIRLHEAEINAIGITRGSEIYQLDQVRASAVVQEQGLVIENLVIDSEKLNISLAGNLKPVKHYPHDIKLRWRAVLPSGAIIESQGAITGDLKYTRVIQDLQGALQLRLELELRELLTQPTWQSSLDISSFDTTLLDTSLPPLRGQLAISASGDTEAARISGQLKAESAEFGPVSANFKLSSLDGESRFDGINFDELEISVLQGQFFANGQFNWSPVLRWEADIKATQVNPGTLLPEWPGNIEAQLSSSGQVDAGELTASASISRLHGNLRDYPVSLQSELRWKNNGLDVTQLNFSSGDTKIKAEGRVSEILELRWSLDSSNLAELYPQAQGLLKASGDLAGPRESPTIRASFNGKSLQLPGYELARVQGNLVLDLLKPEQLNLELSGEELNLQGHILRSVEIVADPNHVRARIIADDVSAQIGLDGTLEVDQWHGKLVQADIQTRDYQSWKLKAPASLSLSKASLVTDEICLLGSSDSEICSRIERLDERWKVGFDVIRVPLHLLDNWAPSELKIKGLANASANLEYQFPDKLLGKVNLDLPPGMAIWTLAENSTGQFDYRHGRLELDLQGTELKANTALELVNGDRMQASIVLPGANLLTLNHQTQTFQASATLKARDLGIVDTIVEEVDELQGVIELDIEASGTLAEPRIKGKAQLRDGGLSLPAIKLKLAQLNFSAQSETHEEISYRGDALIHGGELSMRGDTQLNAADGWPSKISLEGKSLNIGYLLQSWLPEDTRVEGMLNTSATLNFKAPDNLTGEIKLFAPSGTLSYPLLEGEIENWEYRDSSLNLVIDQRGVRGKAEVSIGEGNTFDGNLNLPQARLLQLDLENQPVEASAKLIFKEVAIIEAVLPDIDQLHGSLALNLNVDGTLAKPTLTGRADIRDAAVNIPRLGLKIERVSLQGASDSENQFKFQLEAYSGDGRLAISGVSQLDANSGWPTTLNVNGSEFEVARIPEATVTLSPDLVVRLKGRSIDIQGDLLVPYAKLQPRDITTAAQVSNDVIIIDSSENSAPKWLITNRINLMLGERVSFFGFGFEGQLAGNLLIEEQAGALATGIGEIKVPKGRYRAYGQRLDIENGRLLFAGGPLTNPGLDIDAIRKTGNVIAGIHVRGTLKQPELELYSNPAMGQTDTLSYLLLGRPMETASGEDGAMMAQAALALGLSGGDQLARVIGDRFGLDEMRIESNDTGDQASLVLGRYLSPKLYVSYGVGLIGSFNTLNLRYQISERWQLKTESGENQGADLMYTIER